MKKYPFLALPLLASLAFPASASIFVDVPSTHWASPFVTQAEESNLVSGIGNNLFSPDTSLTYGEFSVIICNGAFGGMTNPSIYSNHWGYEYYNQLTSEGLFLTNNVNTNNSAWRDDFPDTIITRETVAVVVSNLLVRNGLSEGTLAQANQFPDIASSTLLDAQKIQLATAVANGIMTGTPSGNFGVGESLTRAEASVIIKNMLDKGILTPKNDEKDWVLLKQDTSLGITLTTKFSISNYAGHVAGTNFFSVGNHMVVVDGNPNNDSVMITTYVQGSAQEVSTKTVAKELPIFGGAYLGESYNYIIFGEDNPDEIASKIVYSIVKYDKNWNKITSLSVNAKDSYTQYPFHAGTCSISEENGELVIHTARLRLTSSDGLNHQSQITFVIDSNSMTLKDSNPLATFQKNHVSHSFQQFVLFNDNGHVLLDVGDAYPRAIVIHEMISGVYKETELYEIPMIGEENYNNTGIKVGSFVESSDNLLISHSRCDAYIGSTYRNPMVLIYNKNSKKVTEFTYSDCISRGRTTSEPYLVETAINKFMLLWEEYDVSSGTSYGVFSLLIDQNGNKLSEVEHHPNKYLPNAYNPISVGDKVFWIGSKNDQLLYFDVDVPAVGLVADNTRNTG